MIFNFSQIIKIIFFSKFNFLFPKKNKILIYDSHSSIFAKIIFKNMNFEVMHTRLEEINLSVFIISIIKYGLNNLSFNYRKTYLSFVNPKIVFSSVDTNIGFYLLKEKLKKYIFISVQNGMRLKKHYLDLQKQNKKIGKKLKMDYIFTLGEVDKNELIKVFDAKIVAIGNIFCNSFKINKNEKKEKTVIYIQQASLPLKKNPKNFAQAHQKDIFYQEIHLIKLAYAFCKKNKLKFVIFIKRPNTKNIITNATKLQDLNFKNFSANKKIGYKTLDKSKLVITSFSSLGFESISRGNKTVILPPKKALVLNKKWFPLIKMRNKKINNQKFFLFGKINQIRFDKHVKSIISSSPQNWNMIRSEVSKSVMKYNAKNQKISKIINEILN